MIHNDTGDVKTPVLLDSIILGLQRFGGISTYWKQLTSGLCHHDQLDVELRLPHPAGAPLDDSWNINAHATSRDLFHARIAQYLPVRHRNSDQIFHSSYYRRPTSRRVQSVATVYDFMYERYRKGPALAAHRWQKQCCIARANALICISESTRADLTQYANVDPRQQIHVIPLAVDHTTFFPDPSSTAYTDTVLFVGVRAGYKRFDLAVESVRRMPDKRLGIVGPALTEDETTSLNQELGSRWVPYSNISQNDLRQLYSSSYAFVFPSEHEGFGLPALEAMACGCPALLAANSSLLEIGGDSAIFFRTQSGQAIADAMRTLEHCNQRRDVVRSGLEHAANYTWTRTIDATVAVYTALLAGPNHNLT